MSDLIEINTVVTGNRLSDGAVVFLSSAGVWETSIVNAVVAVEPKAAAALESSGEQAIKDNILTDFYMVKVTGEGTTIRPVERRERIRSQGPTVRVDLARPEAAVLRDVAAS